MTTTSICRWTYAGAGFVKSEDDMTTASTAQSNIRSIETNAVSNGKRTAKSDDKNEKLFPLISAIEERYIPLPRAHADDSTIQAT